MTSQSESSTNDLVVCEICGFQGKSLGSHIRRIHGMKKDEYWKSFPGASLTSLTTRDRYSISSKTADPHRFDRRKEKTRLKREALLALDPLDRPDGNLKGQTRREWMSERKEGWDYVVCTVCGFPGRTLANHISSVHGLNRQTYSGLLQCEELNQKGSERIRGEKNPWFNHGGKYSPFSEKFIMEGYDRFETIKKAHETIVPNCSLEYFLKKTNGDERKARRLQRERQQTFTLEKCIDRHGEEEGRRVWEARQQKWKDTINSKSDEEIALINKKKMTAGPVSKREKMLLERIREHVEETQFALVDPKTKKTYVYDFRAGTRIIEFNGDFWHARPTRYAATEPVQWSRSLGRKLLASEVWEKDEKKRKAAEESGFQVMTIWEGDFMSNPEKIAQECVDFLTQSSASSSTLETFMR